MQDQIRHYQKDNERLRYAQDSFEEMKDAVKSLNEEKYRDEIIIEYHL